MSLDSTFKILPTSLLFVALCSCEIGTFEAPEDASLESAQFTGVETAVFNSSNELVIFWELIDSSVVNSSNADEFSYYIHFQKITAGEAELLIAASSAEQATVGNRNAITIDASDLTVLQNPAKSGELLDTVDSSVNSYKVKNDIAPTAGYVFMVTAKTQAGVEIGEPQAFLISAGPLGEFQGCVLGTAVSHSEVKVEFEYPVGASQVIISRDGNPVYIGLTPETVFFDRAVTSNRTYTYTCAAKVGDDTIVGDKTLTVQTPNPIQQLADYQGCITGTATGTSSIQVDFEYPSVADKVEIFRNGNIKVFIATSDNPLTTFIDQGLDEGLTYSYECHAYIGDDSVVGENILSVTTLITNPPTFSGIVSAVDNGGGSALVSWGGTTGVPVSEFKIYSSNSGSLSFSAGELLTTQTNSLSKVVTGIGDELTYIYGVLACASDSACSGSAATQTLTLADTGAPKSSGATAAAIINSKINLTVPYSFSDGAVAKRKVYRRIGATGGTNIADYTLVQTDVIPSPYTAISSTIVVTGAISENTTYHFIVRDEDPSGNTETNTNFVTITTSDLTAPIFSGLDSLADGTAGNEDTEITVNFTPITSQPGDSDGASHYVVYTATGGTDACSAGTVHTELDATNYTSGVADSYVITGLTERTEYSICLKARDSDGNYSTNTIDSDRYTHDLTAPSFDGIQSISFNSGSGDLEVRWNASTSSDIEEYQVNVWKNADSPPGTLYVKAHASFSAGFDLNTSEFSFEGGDTVYIYVNACDDAASLPLSSQNCTTYTDANKKSIVVPDNTAPAGFLGIKGSAFVTSTTEGEADVAWFTPADWSDYAGFYVYNYESATLTLLKDCACTGLDCATNNKGSCELTGLDPFRTYNFHVRAYDLSNNITTYLDPATKSTSRRVIDTTDPTFASSLAATYEAGNGWVALSWTAATDNQYASEPGADITYNLYRKIGSAYADASAPSTDGTLLYSGTTASHNDSSGLNSAAVHYYAICAEDGSGNETCDGVTNQVNLPDVVAPVLSNVSTTKTATNKSWTLNWNYVEDSGDDVSFNLRYTTSASPETPTEGSSTSIDLVVNQTSYAGLSGPINSDTYVNYLIIAEDLAGNKSTASISVYSQNLITISSIKSNQGKTSGGKLVYIQGSGFVDGDTSVAIGGNTCTTSSAYFVDSTKFVCETTAGSAGAADVVVSNTDGSSATLSNGYTYGNSNCDNVPAGQAYTYEGAGLVIDPYVICTADQLKDMETLGTNSTAYFRLDDNLDLTGYTINIPSSGFFDGNDHVLVNYTLKDDTRNDVGLFKNVRYDVNDLGMINVDVEGYDKVAAMFADSVSGTPTLDNLFVTGTIVGHTSVGGILGGSAGGGSFNSTLQNCFSLASVTGYSKVGSLAGGARHVSNCYATGDVTVNSAYTPYASFGGLVGISLGDTLNSYATGDVTATGVDYVGGLVGQGPSAANTVLNCYATGNVSGEDSVGGLIGYARMSTATNSYATGDVTNTGNYLGGLFGRALGISCDGCFATGSATQSASGNNIGGLVGQITKNGTTLSSFINSYATGDVNCTGTSCSYVGGFSGAVASTTAITDSYATGDVTALNDHVGGFIGVISESWTPQLTISGCYSTGAVSSGASNVGGFMGNIANSDIVITESYTTSSVIGVNDVGGFIGELGDNTVTKSYATGTVTSSGSNAGGFVGYVDGATTITDSYATGQTSGSSRVAGFVGYVDAGGASTIERNYSTGSISGASTLGGFVADDDDANTFAECLWDTDTSGQSTSAGGTGKTTSQMQTQSTFDTDNSWDFTAGTGVWEMPGGGGYPVLQ